MPAYRVYAACTDGFRHSEVWDMTGDEPLEAESAEAAIQSVIDTNHGTDVTDSTLRDVLGTHFRAYPVSHETERRLGTALLS